MRRSNYTALLEILAREILLESVPAYLELYGALFEFADTNKNTMVADSWRLAEQHLLEALKRAGDEIPVPPPYRSHDSTPREATPYRELSVVLPVGDSRAHDVERAPYDRRTTKRSGMPSTGGRRKGERRSNPPSIVTL